jgi:hypothetical protein
MSMMVPEVAAKRLGLLKEAVPGISRVLVLTYLDDPIAPLQVKALKDAARSLGVTLQIQDVRTGDDLPAAFEAGAKEHAEEHVRCPPRTSGRTRGPLSIARDVLLFGACRRCWRPDGV